MKGLPSGRPSPGAAALGVFLMLGFTLHNVTEGIGIAAPLSARVPRCRPSPGWRCSPVAGHPRHLAWSLTYSPHWTTLVLAIGAGAILQVIVEVGAYLIRNAGRPAAWLTPSRSAGSSPASGSCTDGHAGEG